MPNVVSAIDGTSHEIQILPYDHDGSSSVKMKGNCVIDIDGIYDYHCLLTFFSYQSMKRIGLLKVCPCIIYLFIYLCFGVSVSTVDRVLNSTWVDL
jgi:hypothetical protein